MSCRIDRIPTQLSNIYSKIAQDTRFDALHISEEGNTSILKIFEQYISELGKKNSSELSQDEENVFVEDLYHALDAAQGGHEINVTDEDVIEFDPADLFENENIDALEARDFLSDFLGDKELLDIDFADTDIINALTDLNTDVDAPFFEGGTTTLTMKGGINLFLKKYRGRKHDTIVLLSKLRNELKSLGKRLSVEGDKEKRALLQRAIEKHKQQIHEIDVQVMKTLHEKTIENVNKLYEKYENWILTTLKNPNISAAEIITVSKAIDTWKNISKIFEVGYKIEDDLLKQLLDIQNRANNPEFYRLADVAKQVFKSKGRAATGIELLESEMSMMENIGSIGENFGNLSHNENRIVAVLDKLIRGANIRISQEVFAAKRVIKESMKNWKKWEHLFLSRDKNGDLDGNLISRYSKKFYDEKSAIKEYLRDKIDAIIVKMSNEAERKAAIKKVFEAKNLKIKNSSYIITTQDLSDIPALRAKLNGIVKDTKYVEKLISDALNKQEHYKEDKAAYLDSLIASGKSAEDAKTELDVWEKNSSPDEYSSYVQNETIADGDFRYFDEIDKYAVEVPLRVDELGLETGYYDNRFNEILSNPEASEAYNNHLYLLEKYLGYLPNFAIDKVDGTFIPNVKNGLMLRVLNSGNILGAVGREAIDMLTVEDGEGASYLDFDGKVKKAIPIRYINKIDAKEKSYKIEENLNAFAEMAIRYKHLSIIEDNVNLGKMIVERMRPIKLGKNGKPIMDGKTPIYDEEEGLNHILGLINHTIDTNLYDNPINKQEGITKSKLTSSKKRGIKFAPVANPAPIIAKFLELTEKLGWDEAIDKMLKDDKYAVETNEKDSKKYINEVIQKAEDDLEDGIIEQGDFDSKKEIYDKFYGKLGKAFSWRKFTEAAITAGAIKVFSWMPFPAMANLGFGWVQILSYAAGREDFTPAEAMTGMKKSFEALLKSARTDSWGTNKIMNLAVKWGVLAEMGTEVNGMSDLNLNILKPFGMMGSTDFWLRTNVLASMMEHKKIKDIHGVEHSLADAFLDNGEWDVVNFGDNKDWNADVNSVTGNKELNNFITHVKLVNQKLHGNFSKETAFKAKRTAIVRLATQFRLSWLADAVRDRVEDRRFDQTMGRYTEGRYRSMVNLVAKNGVMKSGEVLLKLMAFQGEDAFNNVRISKADKAMVVANIRKNLMELYILTLLKGATLLLSGSIDDDDEDTKSAKYVVLNSLNRVLTNITFFMNVKSFEDITNNVIPALGLITDGRRWVDALSKYSEDDPYWNGDKVVEATTRMFPGLRMYNVLKYNMDRELLTKN